MAARSRSRGRRGACGRSVMLPDDGESVGLDTNRLPLTSGPAGGLYPGVSDGGRDGFSCSVSLDGTVVGLPACPTLSSLRVKCLDGPGLPKESFRKESFL